MNLIVNSFTMVYFPQFSVLPFELLIIWGFVNLCGLVNHASLPTLMMKNHPYYHQENLETKWSPIESSCLNQLTLFNLSPQKNFLKEIWPPRKYLRCNEISFLKALLISVIHEDVPDFNFLKTLYVLQTCFLRNSFKNSRNFINQLW